jgi:hypothetical protein
MGKMKIMLIFCIVFFWIRMIYSSASRILCLQNEINRTRAHSSRVFIEISTSNTDLIDYSLQLENITEYLLE